MSVGGLLPQAQNCSLGNVFEMEGETTKAKRFGCCVKVVGSMPMGLSYLLFHDNGKKYGWTLLDFASSELFNAPHKFRCLQLTLEMCFTGIALMFLNMILPISSSSLLLQFFSYIWLFDCRS